MTYLSAKLYIHVHVICSLYYVVIEILISLLLIIIVIIVHVYKWCLLQCRSGISVSSARRALSTDVAAAL